MGRVGGKVAVITGAAKGLGEADARLLAREGAQVVLTDVDVEAGMRVAAEIGASARFLRHDVTVEDRWREVVAEVMAIHGRLDVLVNNAGIAEVGSIESTTEAEWRRVMAVSADGSFFGCKHAIGAMRAGGGGSIVNMASIASLRGHWPFTAYCAAKGAVEAMTRAVAVYAVENSLNIRCNSVHPSGFETPMVRDVGPKLAALGFVRPPGPISGLGQPTDVANLILFLASDESRYINGQALSVDAGASVI